MHPGSSSILPFQADDAIEDAAWPDSAIEDVEQQLLDVRVGTASGAGGGEGDGDGQAAALPWFGVDIAAMGAGHCPDDGQPQAGAGRVGGEPIGTEAAEG